MNARNTISFLIAATIVVSCSAPKDDGQQAEKEDVGLTTQQRQLADVQTSTLQYRVMSAVVSCTGEIEVPPQGMASVTAPLGGYIERMDMVAGTFVKKGTLLATLRNPEYIVLQQSYLETSGQLKFAELDYSRQKTLVEQNAAALKKLQESESSYNVLKARLTGLQRQLQMIGIDLKELEKGNIQSSVTLRSPLSGYVTEVNNHQGQFVEPREVIFQIVDLSDLHLHLNVFEQDIARVKKGQSVKFRPAGALGEAYRGEVSLISPQRNADVRTFDVHGHIEAEDGRLKPGMFVEAQILLSADSVPSLPRGAIVRKDQESFVLVEEQGTYRVVPVDFGDSLDGWVEIRNHEVLQDKLIVTQGASRVYAAMTR